MDCTGLLVRLLVRDKGLPPSSRRYSLPGGTVFMWRWWTDLRYLRVCLGNHVSTLTLGILHLRFQKDKWANPAATDARACADIKVMMCKCVLSYEWWTGDYQMLFCYHPVGCGTGKPEGKNQKLPLKPWSCLWPCGLLGTAVRYL